MRDDEAGLGPAHRDQVPEVGVVLLDVALAGTEPEALFEEPTEVDRQGALLRILVDAARVGWNVEAWDTERSGRGDGVDQLVQDDVGDLVLFAARGGRARAGRLVADGIYALVGPLPASHVFDLLDRVRFVVVDGDGAYLFGLVQPLLDMVDRVDFRGPSDHAAIRGHQSHRTGSVDGDAFSRLHARELGTVVASREDVGEERIVGLVLLSRREDQAVKVSEWDPEILGLSAGVRAHRNITVGPAGEPRVDGDTEAGESTETVLAEAAGDVEGHDDPVADLPVLYRRSDLLDDAHVLVAEHDPGLGGRAAFVHVEVGAADAARRYLDDHVVRVLDLRVRDALDCYLEGALIDDCSHRHTSLSG